MENQYYIKCTFSLSISFVNEFFSFGSRCVWLLSFAQLLSLRCARRWWSKIDRSIVLRYVCSDERRLIERFQNSEKFYIQLLKNAATTYLHDLPDDLRATLTVFLDAFDKIVKFHADTFYPKLLQCEMKIITICDMIKTHLDHNEFNIYCTYAAYVHEALHMIQSVYSNAVRHFYCQFCANRLYCCVLFLFYSGLLYSVFACNGMV